MKPIFFILSCALSSQIAAQSLERTVVANSGGLHPQLEWTVGEAVIHAATDNTVTLTQGFIQGDLIISSLDEVSQFEFECSIYPNPFMDALVIQHNNPNGAAMPITLIDMSGKAVLVATISSPQQQVHVGDLAAGIYVMRIQVGANDYRSYQLIKMK